MMTAAGAIPLRCAPTSVETLVRSIRLIMEPQARAADVTLSVQIAEDAPGAVFIDGRKVAWAVTALIGNALRYVRHGTSRMPGGSISVRVTRDAATGDVALEVEDDGPGIPLEQVSLVTGAESDESRGGLALTMIHDVITAHGGQFTIRSRTDAFAHGTTIRLTLPVA